MARLTSLLALAFSVATLAHAAPAPNARIEYAPSVIPQRWTKGGPAPGDKPITFDQADHPDHVPSPGKYLLVVDPVVGNVRLTKVLMDGGSCLNIIYAETLGLLRVDLSSVRAGTAPFHGIILGKRVQPLGRLDLPVCFGTPSNFRRETLTFEVVGFRGIYHAVTPQVLPWLEHILALRTVIYMG